MKIIKYVQGDLTIFRPQKSLVLGTDMLPSVDVTGLQYYRTVLDCVINLQEV